MGCQIGRHKSRPLRNEPASSGPRVGDRPSPCPPGLSGEDHSVKPLQERHAVAPDRVDLGDVEVGIVEGLSATYLVTWLDGREGPDGEIHKDSGWSDAWIGLMYGWGDSSRPMAVALTVRTPTLYDQPGPYTRHQNQRQESRR